MTFMSSIIGHNSTAAKTFRDWLKLPWLVLEDVSCSLICRRARPAMSRIVSSRKPSGKFTGCCIRGTCLLKRLRGCLQSFWHYASHRRLSVSLQTGHSSIQLEIYVYQTADTHGKGHYPNSKHACKTRDPASLNKHALW